MDNATRALGDYKVGKRIASGGFGFVYTGKASNGKRVAIKCERTNSRVTRPYLQHEADVYRLLEGDPCVPKVYAYGREGRRNIMVFDLLGTSLEALFEKCEFKFSLKTMLMLAPQIIECIEYIHSKGIIHRDIKPDNFLMGTGDRTNFVHIIDFGLSRRFRHPRTLEHFPYFEGHNFFGTTRFGSLKALEGCSQSRRDDLESAAYSLVYFVRGRLPWQGLRGGTEKHRDQRVREKKRTWTPERLCEGLLGAEELIKMLHHVKSLSYTDEPNYAYLKGLFKERFKKEGYELDYDYDWLHIVDEEFDSGDGLSATGSRLASSARRSAGDRASVDSGSADDELDVPVRKVPGTPTSKPKVPPSIKTDSEISPISAGDYLKNRIESRNASRSRGTPATKTRTKSDAPRSLASRLSDVCRSRSEGSSPSSTDSSIDGEAPVRKGDLVLIKFIARPTLEKGSLKSHSSVPVDTSYWHNPELSEEEWHFPFRPALVTEVDVCGKYTRLSVLPVMQRHGGLEKISPPRRPAFFEVVADKEAAAADKGKDDQGALKIQTSPAWPLAGTYVLQQFDTFKIHVPTDNVKDIKVVWRLDKVVLKSLVRARDDIVSVLHDDDYLSDAGSETGWVRRRFRRRHAVVKYPLFGDIASLTEEALARSDVDFKGSNGWLPEFFKVDRRRNHENGYYTGDSDYEDDENESCYTGRAPGNRRLSCTLAIDGDTVKEASLSDRDSVASSRYRSPRSSGAGPSYRSGASSRRSRASSAAGAKARDARSLRHAILKSAVRSGYNTPMGSDSSRDASQSSAPSSPIGSAPGSSCSLSTQVSLPPSSAGSTPGSSTGFSSSRPASASACGGNCSCAGSNAGSVRSAVSALTAAFEGMNEAATAIERKIMVDKGVQTSSTDLNGSSSPGIAIKAEA